jgi:DNA repair exonuclease SbcCD ATPase subunit
MRITTKGDAKDLETLATRIAGKKTNAARRQAVTKQLRELNPHAGDFDALPPETPLIVPDDVPESDDQTPLDPRAAEALRIAGEAVEAARTALQTAAEQAKARDDQREKDLREQRQNPETPDRVKQIDAEIEQLRKRRDESQADVKRVTGALDATAGRVTQLREQRK